MVRILVIIFLISAMGLVMLCSKDPGPEMQSVEKAERFRSYTEALDNCKKLPVDSLLRCAREIYNIDTLKNINLRVWQMYGRSKALLHNKSEIEAIEVINLAIPEAESNDLIFEKAAFLQLRSFIYGNSFKNSEAAEDLYKAADLYLKLGLRKQAAVSYLGLENLQFNSGNYHLAIENGIYAMKLIKDSSLLDREDSMQLMNVYNTLGLAFYKLNDYDDALRYYDSSGFLAVQLGDEFWEGLVTGNIAVVLFRDGKIEEAIDKFEKDIRISLKYKDLSSASSALLSMGELYVSVGRYKAAKNYYDSAYNLINRVNVPSLKEKYYKNISEWHRLNGDYTNAFLSYQKHISLRDSIQKILTNSHLEKIQNERKFEKQLADINLLRAENELRTKELKFSRASIVAFILVFLLLTGLLYTIKKNNKTLNELNLKLEDKVRTRTTKLRKINTELDTYLYRASHDVRRPILTIIGLSQIADLTPYEQERFAVHQAIKKTAYEMDNMLKKLQMAYEIEKETSLFAVNINNHLDGLISGFQKQYPAVAFSLIEGREAVAKVNRHLLDIVLTNILENACIFSVEENHRVTVKVMRTDKWITISVADDGIGIESYYIKSIFDAYTRFSNKSHGSGIGLYLAVKAIKKIGGTISVNSIPGVGSEFSIRVPVNQPVI